MKPIGQFAPSTRSDLIFGWIGLDFLSVFLLPWIMIAIGRITVGIGAVFRGERVLIVCFPAGIALFELQDLGFYLHRRWHPRISQFVLDDNVLTYTLSHESEAQSRQINDVWWAEHRMHRGHTRGYLVKFRDGNGI